MITIRQALAIEWTEIGDIIVRHADPAKREITIKTIMLYEVDHIIHLMAPYAKNPEMCVETHAMLQPMLAAFGIDDADAAMGELQPHIEAMLKLLK